jgi:hypothetical protein
MNRRASVYLLALLVVLVVAGIAVVMARGASIRVQAHDQALAQAQCRVAAMGVVRAVLNDLTVAMNEGKTPYLPTVVASGETVGNCTVLLIGRDPAGKSAQFGLVPDAGRISVNTLADSTVMPAIRTADAAALASLPGMTTAIVAALRDWRDADDTPDAEGGAERTDGAYLGAAVSYAPRNAPLETLEEIRLVRDVTDTLYFGGDINRNGRLDSGETSDGTSGVLLGLRDVLCLESREPSIAGDGTTRVAIIAGNNRPRLNTALSTSLASWFDAARGAAIWKAMQDAATDSVFVNRLDLFSALADTLSDSEMTTLWPHLIGPEGRVGLIDAWSCPDVVLVALMGSDLAATIAKARPTTPPTGPAWLARALTREQAKRYGHLLTSGSYRFHADVLAVRNDGAGWVRWDAAIDCTTGTAALSALRPAETNGWPLPWCTPEQLRRRDAGQDPITLLTTAPK